MDQFNLGLEPAQAVAKKQTDKEPAAAGAKSAKKERRAIIIIDQERDKPNYEFVGVNGKGYQIKRGEEVTVPASVVGVLNNAIATRSVTDVEGRVVGEQNYHAVPFRVVRWLE